MKGEKNKVLFVDEDDPNIVQLDKSKNDRKKWKREDQDAENGWFTLYNEKTEKYLAVNDMGKTITKGTLF